MVSKIADTRFAPISRSSGSPRHLKVSAAKSTATIVLADDDHNIVSLLADLLEEEGYEVLCASNGQQAWRLCEQHDPNLVITDVMMPGMSGWDLVSRLRQAACDQAPPVIVMSAVRQTVPVSGVAFLPKPFDLDEMLDSVAAGLETTATA